MSLYFHGGVGDIYVEKRKSSLLSSVPDGRSEDEGRLVWGRALPGCHILHGVG